MNASLDSLFTPFRLGPVTLRNRFAMSPMTRCFSPGGVPGQNVADYYQRRAQGSVGLIFTEGTGIDHPAALGMGSAGEKNVPHLCSEAAIAGWKRVVDAVHAAGGIIFPQLWHMGAVRVDGTGDFPDAPSCRPSGSWGPEGRSGMMPQYLEAVMKPTRPMTDREIADVIAGFARSAVNARAAGFDGIAVHGAHGYLIDTFFWSETNRRTDAYGGDLVQRTRFGADVVRAIRAAVGANCPIVFRYSQWKQQEFGAQLAKTPQELEQLLTPLVDAGVDLFDASARVFHAPAFADSNLTLAGWTKKVTGKPSMAVGGVGLKKDLYASFQGGSESVDNVEQVAALIGRGEFDLIAVGRALLLDPEWLAKVRAGEPFKPFNVQAVGELS